MPNVVSPAVTLVEYGVIPVSPEQPKLGFSIGTLAFYDSYGVYLPVSALMLSRKL